MRSLLKREKEVEELLRRVPPKVVGARLARARMRQGLSIRELAQAANVNKNSIVRLESGGTPQPLTVLKLCEAMGIHVATISEPERSQESVVAVHRQADDRWFDLENLGAGAIAEGPIGDQDRQKLAQEGMRALMLMHGSRLESGQLIARVIELYAPTEIRSHLGEELVYVLKGRVLLEVAGTSHELAAGESATFWSAEPHRYLPAAGSELPATFLSITVYRMDRKTASAPPVETGGETRQ